MREKLNIEGRTFRFLQGRENAAGGETKLTVGNGCVFGEEKAEAAYQEGNVLCWGNKEEKGALWLYHHGFAAHGFIEKDGERKEIAALADDAEYTLSYTGRDGKEIKFDFAMGTRNNPASGGFLLYGKLSMGRTTVIESFACDENGNILPGQEDNGFFRTSFSEGQNGRLRAELDLSSRWILDEDLVHSTLGEEFNIWSADFTFSPDYSRISGEIFEQETENGVTKKGKKFSLEGQEKERGIRNQNFRASAEDVQTLKAVFQTLGEAPKSLTELYTLPAPNMADANKLATETLYYLAVYFAAGKKFRCKGTEISWNCWFGLDKEKARERVADVDSRILELAEGPKARKEVTGFLEKYAEACLANSYAGSSEKTLSDALSKARERLKKGYSYCGLPDLCSFYLQGDGATCLAQDPGYSIVMEEINRYAYAKLTPGLRKYIEDRSGNWAEKLYGQCTKNLQQLRVTALTGTAGSTEISHKSMMLTILDGKEHEISDGTDGRTKVSMTYGAALYAKIFNLQLAEMADSLGVEYTSSGGEGFVQMMRKIYNVIWEELQKETSDYFAQDILKQFQELQKQYAQLTREEFIQGCVDMTEAGMELIRNGKTLVALFPCLSTLSQKPWAAYTAGVCSIVFYATSIAGLSTVFMNWKDTDPLEKAEAILTCVQGVANIAVAAVKINNIRILINPASTFDEKINASLRLRFDGEDMATIKGLAEANGQEFDVAVEDMAKRYSTSVTTAEAEQQQVSAATKYFRAAEIAVRALNILMMGFVTVVSAVKLAKEAREGGYTVSVCLEIIATSLMAISFVCEAIAFVGDLMKMTCSVMPVIGAVTAFVGIIFQVVAGALRKPVNPLVEFIQEEIVPFLDSLTIPSEDWVKDHKKRQALYAAV